MSSNDKDAVASATQNANAATETGHRGWNVSGYSDERLEEMGGYTPVEPNEKVDWEAVWRRTCDEIDRLKNKKAEEGLTAREQEKLEHLTQKSAMLAEECIRDE